MKTYNKNVKLRLMGYDNTKLQFVHSYKEIYIHRCKQYWNTNTNLCNEEKFTMLGGR